jgi:hypothetical protein
MSREAAATPLAIRLAELRERSGSSDVAAETPSGPSIQRAPTGLSLRIDDGR